MYNKKKCNDAQYISKLKIYKPKGLTLVDYITLALKKPDCDMQF